MKTNKNEEYTTPGQDCQCYAHSESECACNVDWTDPLIYKQREEIRELRAALDSAQKRNGALEVVIKGAQQHIDEVKKANLYLTSRVNEIDSDQNREYQNQILELKNQIAILKQENEIHLTRIAHYMDEDSRKNSPYPLHWGGFDVRDDERLKKFFNTNFTACEAKVTEETPRMRQLLNKLMGKTGESEVAPAKEERSWEEAAEILAIRLVKLEEQIKNLNNEDYGQ